MWNLETTQHACMYENGVFLSMKIEYKYMVKLFVWNGKSFLFYVVNLHTFLSLIFKKYRGRPFKLKTNNIYSSESFD